MKKLRNSSGSALLWTVMVLSMLMVFCTAVLTMAMAYSKQTINQNQNQQAYFTALSAVNIVAKQFSGIYLEGSSQQKIMEKLDKGETIEINDLSMPSEMGKVKLTMKMRSGGPIVGDIVITADAEKNGMTYRLSAILKGDVTIIRHENPNSDYGGDGTPGLGAGSVTGGSGMLTDPDTDFYIWDSKNPFAIDTDGNSNDAIHMGALYTNGPVEVRCKKWRGENAPYTHLHGEIISTNNILIDQNATVGLLPSEFLPVGKTDCCDNTDPSYIHTTGTVSMKSISRMGGDITANRIEIMDAAAVLGNLTANSLLVSCNWGDDERPTGYYSVAGSISANEVIIAERSVVKGDITAQKVILSGSAKVEGNITAETVEILEAASVTGKITADKLTINGYQPKAIGDVMVNDLEMKNGAVIKGNIITQIVWIDGIDGNSGKCIIGNLSYFRSDKNKIDELRRLTSGSVALMRPIPPAVVPPQKLPPIVSTMPPLPAKPPMPPIPTNPPPQNLSGSTVTVGDPDYDSYYIINHNGIGITQLNVDSDKNIFIYLPDSFKATIGTINDNTSPPPNLFFILGRGSELTLGSDSTDSKLEFPAYIWSEKGSGAKLKTGRNSSIVGGIWVDEVAGGENSEYHWIPPDLTVNAPPATEPTPSPEPTLPPEAEDPDMPDENDEVVVKWALNAYENR